MQLFKLTKTKCSNGKSFKIFQVMGMPLLVIERDAKHRYHLHAGRKIKDINELRQEFEVRKKLNSYGSNVHVLYPPQGLGDILIVCSLLKEYKKVNPGKEIVIYVTKKHFYDLTSLYAEDIFEIIFHHKGLDDVRKIINLNNRAYKNKTFYDIYKNSSSLKGLLCQAMRISEACAFQHAEIPLLEDSSLNRTVLLAPDAESTPKIISDDYWDDMANKIKEKGYEVIINCPDKNRFKNQKTVFWDIKTTIQKVRNMKAFVSYRSGLADVIGAFCLHVPQFVIYPDKDISNTKEFISNDAAAKAYLDFCSIKNIFNNEIVSEYIYSSDIAPYIVAHVCKIERQ